MELDAENLMDIHYNVTLRLNSLIDEIEKLEAFHYHAGQIHMAIFARQISTEFAKGWDSPAGIWEDGFKESLDKFIKEYIEENL